MVGVVIPVRDQMWLTASICGQLLTQSGWEQCIVFDNGSTDMTGDFLHKLSRLDSRFVWAQAGGKTIYEMWDEGLRWAKANEHEYVAFLNNDVVLAPRTFTKLQGVLAQNPTAAIAYPDYDLPVRSFDAHTIVRACETKGTYRHGGMCGYAFLLRTSAVTWEPMIDPQFIWWGGDDDLAFEVERHGDLQLRAVGLPVDHIGEATVVHFPELLGQKARDLAAVSAKWGR